MVSSKEETQLNTAIENSIITAAMDMRSPCPPNSHHRLNTEPIAKNEDYTTTVAWAPGLTAFQRSQTMGAVDYQQRSSLERFKMHFTDAELSDGDTLVFVDFPEAFKGKGKGKGKVPVDCDGIPFRSKSIRVHSEKLRATKSLRFHEMLQPNYQFRVQRRRKLVNKLPEGVKYVLDLTPPSEGEEAVFQITEMSLTPGIIKWWSSYARLDVPYFLVKGHDDVCPCKELAERSMADTMAEPVPIKDSGANSGSRQDPVRLPLSVLELVSARDDQRQLQIVDVPAHFAIKDYCPIRHRNGIIRLLMLIEGKQVFINSASRLWTLVALAKIWDCVSVVQDPAIQWLMQGKNSKFLEILPEEAIRIGGILENAQITRTAFRILVSELAFEQTATSEMKQGIDLTHVTLYGRKKGDPGDEFSNLIQHAALAFVERATNLLTELQSPDVLETWNIPEYMRLLKLEECLRQSGMDLFNPTMMQISNVKATIASVLASDINGLSQSYYLHPSVDRKAVDSDRATYVEPPDFREFREICELMTPLQRLLTPYPYERLESSWNKWATFDLDGASSYRSMTERSRAIAHDMSHLQNCFENLLPREKAIRSMPKLVFCAIPREDIFYPFMPETLDTQVRSKLVGLGGRILENVQDLQTVSTKHLLLSLTSNETKFLPLWAGGLNDGTGGVFVDQLPPAEMGPNGPGPAYHTGITVASDTSSLSGSFVDDMSAMSMEGSVTAASMDVRGSVSTAYRPGQVIADDESILSESFRSDLTDFYEAKGEDAVVIDALAQSTQQGLLQTMDEFPQQLDSDSDSDSGATIGYDDFDWLAEYEDEMYTNKSDAASEYEGSETEMVVV